MKNSPIRSPLKLVFLVAGLLACLPQSSVFGAEGTPFVTVRYDSIPTNGSTSLNEKAPTGRLTVVFLDESGANITAKAKAQRFQWFLEKKDRIINVAIGLEPGVYRLRLQMSGLTVHHPVPIKPAAETIVEIRPGVVRMSRQEPDRRAKLLRLLFSPVPDNVGPELFQKIGCAVVTPGPLITRELPLDGSDGAIYLPPGLYRAISDTDRRFLNTIFVSLAAGQHVSLEVNEKHVSATPRTAPPIFHGKCYY